VWLGESTSGAFSSMMIQSAMVLPGAPKPAFYDGLLLQSSEPEVDKLRAIVNGWRTIESSGKEVLPVECFVACNQSFVPNKNAVQFEERWANRESKLKEMKDSEELALSVSKIAQSLIEEVDLSIPGCEECAVKAEERALNPVQASEDAETSVESKVVAQSEVVEADTPVVEQILSRLN